MKPAAASPLCLHNEAPPPAAQLMLREIQPSDWLRLCEWTGCVCEHQEAANVSSARAQ